jgi:hypothetical protein
VDPSRKRKIRLVYTAFSASTDQSELLRGSARRMLRADLRA